MRRFIFTDFGDVVRGARKAAAVITFSISVTTAVILAFVAILFETVGDLRDLDYDSRFYGIPVVATGGNFRMESMNQLLFGDYPEIIEMWPFMIRSYQILEYEQMTEEEILALPPSFSGYTVVDPSFCDFLYIPSPAILRGRWFTQEEILNGENVVVLSQPWLEENRPELDPDTLEDYIINDVPYRVVGITDGVDEGLEGFYVDHNYIPYRTLERNETDNSGFYADGYQVFIEFTRPLTREERLEIAESFARGGYLDMPKSNLDQSGSGVFWNTLMVLGIAVVMVFVCALNILGLFRSVLKLNSYRYMVYKVCGARSAVIARALRFTTLCLTALSGGLGCLLFGLVSLAVPASVFPLAVPWYGYLAVLLLLVGLMQLIIRPMIRDIARRQPMDRRLWR